MHCSVFYTCLSLTNKEACRSQTEQFMYSIELYVTTETKQLINRERPQKYKLTTDSG